MLRCRDNSIYTGITNDLARRMNEHFFKSKNGAKYTKSHDAIRLEIAWQTEEKTNACKLEYWIKKLTKAQKEELILSKNLTIFLEHKLSCHLYEVVAKMENNSIARG